MPIVLLIQGGATKSFWVDVIISAFLLVKAEILITSRVHTVFVR